MGEEIGRDPGALWVHADLWEVSPPPTIKQRFGSTQGGGPSSGPMVRPIVTDTRNVSSETTSGKFPPRRGLLAPLPRFCRWPQICREPDLMRLVVSLPALTCLAQALTPNLALAQNQGQESWSTQPTSSNAARDASRPVAGEALDHYDAGRYAEAIIRFQQADSMSTILPST